MAIGNGSVFQVQSTATAGNVNGGGFNPDNTHGITDGVISGGTGNTPTLSSATYSFVAGDIGHWIYFPTQANITSGWYQIASQTGGVATLSAAIGQAIQNVNNLFRTNAVAGCATTATPSGVTYLVDYSQSDTARYSSSTLTGTTTSATDAGTNPFTAQMVGNFICMASGTGVTVGWYEIVSISAGTATLSSSAGASYSSVVCKIGGAISLGGSTTGITDANFFSLMPVGSSSAAGRTFIKGGSSITYSPAVAISFNNAQVGWPPIIEGYASTRGDRPTGNTRPTFSMGTNGFQGGAYFNIYSMQFTGSGSTTLNANTGTGLYYCKAINTSTTASRSAIYSGSGTTGIIFGCEAVCYYGYGIYVSINSVVAGCYIHDCAIGIHSGTGGTNTRIYNNIISSCTTSAFDNTVAFTTPSDIIGNTFYGAENKTGLGLNILTATVLMKVFNNIFYGFTTAVTHPDVQTGNIDNYNCYYNNTNDVSDVTHWQKGMNDVTVNPTFTNVTQITGTTATTTAGNHLVQSGATFITSGVVAGVDYVYIKSGTGVTAGVYGIVSVDSETQITVDNTLTADATANKSWQITLGHNFAIGTPLKSAGFPGTFPGGFSTSHLDIGAVQRIEGSGGGGSFTFG